MIGISLNPVDAHLIERHGVGFKDLHFSLRRGEACAVKGSVCGEKEHVSGGQQVGVEWIGRAQPAQGVEKEDEQGQIVRVGQISRTEIKG